MVCVRDVMPEKPTGRFGLTALAWFRIYPVWPTRVSRVPITLLCGYLLLGNV